jgi:hypothetical protein
MSNLKTIEQGTIYLIPDSENPIPVYAYSSFYVMNGKVVPDGTNFIRAKTSDGDVAVHSSEVSHTCLKVKDVEGNDVYCIRGEYPYIEARRGDRYVYFLDELSAERNGFKFSFRLNCFADGEHHSFYGDEKTLRYHTHAERISAKNRLKQFHTEQDSVLMGLEVEKVDYSLRNNGEAWKILEETAWSKEEDGSLGSNGYELVSPILPLFDINRIKQAISPVTDWINGDSNEDCGGHITLSKRETTTEAFLESMKQFAPILYSLYPKRLENRYCRAKQWSKYFSYPEKYSAFFAKDGMGSIGGRVEIRLFARVRNEENLLWRIELLQLLVNDGGSLNQFAQRIGCPESVFYKHFAKQYTHEGIGKKLRLMDEYSKKYGTHRNGISPSVKKRINNTMGYDVFSI